LDCFKDEPLETAIILSLFYGLRRSEVLGLKWDAVDFENNTLSVKHVIVKVGNEIIPKNMTKNGSTNDVFPLPDIIKSYLLKLRDKQQQMKELQPNDYNDSGFVCVLNNGNPLKPDYISQRFRKVLIKNDLPLLRYHDLRHSTATFLKCLGIHIRDMKEWMKHRDIKSTMVYAHSDMIAKIEMATKMNEQYAGFILQ